MKKEEIRSIVGRDDADIQKLLQWLNTHEKVSLEYVHPHRDWVTISTSIRNVEKLFSCTLGYIVDATSGFEKIASVNRKYSIPESMKDIIEVCCAYFLINALPLTIIGYSILNSWSQVFHLILSPAGKLTL